MLNILISERQRTNCEVFFGNAIIPPSKFKFCLDILATLKTLENNTIMSQCVLNGTTSLSEIQEHDLLSQVALHRYILGNEIADKYPRTGSEALSLKATSDVCIPFGGTNKDHIRQAKIENDDKVGFDTQL